MRNIILLLCLVLSACAKPISHGKVISEKNITQIKTALLKKNEVRKLIGSPTVESDENNWYYIHNIYKKIAFLKPKLVSETIVKISFDDKGSATNVESFENAENACDIEISKEEEGHKGHKLNKLQEALLNLQRFKATPTAKF